MGDCRHSVNESVTAHAHTVGDRHRGGHTYNGQQQTKMSPISVLQRGGGGGDIKMC